MMLSQSPGSDLLISWQTPTVYCSPWHLMLKNIHLASLGQLFRFGPLPSSCVSPAFSTGRPASEVEKPLALCKHCSATPKHYQHYFSPISKPASMKKINSTETYPNKYKTKAIEYLNLEDAFLFLKQLFMLVCNYLLIEIVDWNDLSLQYCFSFNPILTKCLYNPILTN